MRKFRKIVFAFIMVLLVGGLAFTSYVQDYYKAESKVSAPSVLVDYGDDIVIRPVNTDLKIGIAFYPGAKVASDAYIELLSPLAERGYTVVIAQMPFNLSVLNPNRMNDIIKAHQDIDSWYLGGHSLGAAMVGNYVSSYPETTQGIFFLAGYSAKDLSEYHGSVISILGSHDTVLNQDKYLKNKENLPSKHKELTIEGANHAQFGSYGVQKGDGIARIPNAHQQELSRQLILTMINEGDSW